MNSTILTTSISSGIAILGVFVSIILSKRQIKASSDLFDKQIEFDKNNEISQKVASYLAELTRTYDVLKNFLENRRALENVQQQISNIVQNGGNLDYMLGNDPRQEMQTLSETLNSLHTDWKSHLKKVEESSQELLLYFNKLEAKEIEDLILYAPRNLSRYNWVFTTNFPENMLKTTFDALCGGVNIPKNIEDIRDEMRKVLN
ncbi:hypothetical protein [Streptococcus iniae]|uniref:hypothetical protein n=1 Tax=Streptococcus iniae TaxID=1346 RepID=UPI000EF6D7F7|nr:hypothetical protein [Streptococcus iniae]RLU54917.1 hypothetical protein DIY04_04475 [Streptococcus iniae]RLU61379.1 hypothetical protein DIY02_04280 [Streptococcus iniae]RLU62833.1 hypothetical protein DIY01_04090 [Streptococcus iniae]RLU71438.1 hypothetical protein DIX97_04280 [Streptococcus iniae]RLU85254.1 hypothetical protein DIX91_04080 [Streptococcus iniae]